MTEPLFERFDRIYKMSPELKGRLESLVQNKRFRKKEYLLREGQIAHDLVFVSKGLARAFQINEGIDITTKFIKEGQFITSWSSFYKQAPSNEFVEALEDMEVICFPYSELQALYSDFIEFSFIARVFFEYHFYLAEERISALHQGNAEKKYLFFLEKFPDLIYRLPQQYIASFLGITKETLSRTRSRLQKKS